MPNVLDSLAVRLEADLDPLRRGMREGAAVVRQGADNITAALGKLDSTLAKIGLGFAGLVSVDALQGLYQAGRAALSTAGDLAELAEQAGISTDSLQVLVAAGVQAGAKVEDITTAMGRFSKALATAALEGGQVGDTFNKLGINTRNSAGGVRDTMDALVDTAEALSKIESPAQRIQVAMELLGRGGAKLLPILSQGRDGIERFAAEARKMGLVLSADTVKAADDAADKLALMDLKSDQLNRRIATALLPSIVEVTLAIKGMIAAVVSGPSAMDKLIERIDGLQERVNRGGKRRRGTLGGAALPDDLDATGALADLEEQRRRLSALNGAQAKLSADPGKKGLGTRDPVANVIGGLEEQLTLAKISPGLAQDQEKALQQARRAAEGRKGGGGISGAEAEHIRWLVHQLTEAQAKAERLAQTLKGLDDEDAGRGAAMQANRAASGAMQARRFELNQEYEREIDNNNKLIAALGTSTDEYERQRLVIQILEGMRRAGITVGEEEVALANRQATALSLQSRELDALAETQRDVKDGIRGVVSAGAYGIQGLITGTNDWRGALKGVLDELVQIAIRLTLLKPLERGFETLLNGGGSAGGGFNPLSALGSLFNFGGGGGSAAGQAGIAAGNFVPGGFFADGGAPPVGRVSVVGERGPELFVPKVPGTIVPAGRWGSGGGGGSGGMTVIYNIDAAGADPSVVDRIKTVLGDHLRSHPQIVRSTVIAESGRGGAMARAMTRKG